MKQLIAVFSILFLVMATSCNDESKGEIKLVTADEMQTLMKLDGVQLVDVRTPEEYKEGYIANAQNIDFNSPTFNDDISKLDKNKPVILYCKGGGRSSKCSKKLLDAGFVKIYDLQGGITQWIFKGFKINTEQKKD